jgi:hypothetical protein
LEPRSGAQSPGHSFVGIRERIGALILSDTDAPEHASSRLPRPGSLCGYPSLGGFWLETDAALGLELAAPNKTVGLCMGDGADFYGESLNAR